MPVVINSRFTPLTYDEITKPLIQQTEAQQAMEEAYAAASDKAAEVMAEANQQTDPIAYNKLRAYSEDLQKQADALMSKGLQSSSRRALLDMRRRYGQEIAPLQKAAETRKEWAKEQQQARLKNPNLRFQNDAAMMSLADIAANPSIGYGNVVDLDHMYNQAASIGKVLDAAAQEYTVTGKLDKYNNIVEQMGIPIEDVLDPNKRNSNVQKAMQSLFDLSGVGSWNDAKTAEETWNAITLGTIAGLQGPKFTTLDNKEAIANLETDAYITRHNRINNLSDDGSSLDPSSASFLLTPPEEYTGATLRGTGAQVYMKRDAKGKAVYYVRTGTDDNGNYTYSIVDKNNVVTPTNSTSSQRVGANQIRFAEDNQVYTLNIPSYITSAEAATRAVDRITITDSNGSAITDRDKKLRIIEQRFGAAGNAGRSVTGGSTGGRANG